MLWANISLALSKDPAHSTPHSHPSCGNRRQRECQAPLCARNPSEALSGALSGGRLGKWFVPPGNHCGIVLSCFLMTLILCGVHIHVTLSVLGTNVLISILRNQRDGSSVFILERRCGCWDNRKVGIFKYNIKWACRRK